MTPFEKVKGWNVDVDRYIGRFVPRSRLDRMPTLISRFLGYREESHEEVGNVLVAFWALVGTIAGLAVVAAVFDNAASIRQYSPPALIASFGASAVLEYNTINSPLGQPRNALLGHTFSAIVGVGVSKLFQLHPDYDSIKWIAGAVSCGIASTVMLLTGTVHPPGGASAVLATTETAIMAMGWSFVGLVMLGTVLMLCVALVVNNIHRRFPVYWWTPHNPSKKSRLRKCEEGRDTSNGKATIERQAPGKAGQSHYEGQSIWITESEVILPDDLSLNEDEAKLLQGLRKALERRAKRITSEL